MSAQTTHITLSPESIGSPQLWTITVAGLAVLLAVDFILTRRPHRVRMGEALGWSIFYLALPLAFGAYVWQAFGSGTALEFFTGYVVEKSLSVDNLFVFMLLLSAFAVPDALAQRVLLYGIVGALVLRAIFIALGAAALQSGTWAFLLFRRHPDRHRRETRQGRDDRPGAAGRHLRHALHPAAAPRHAGHR
ncbi:TerC family protein, partial [Nonomuraea dietziae]|uniref:TerC family protein n=1 Tax=Nonomuraea dietziae TaxID=65515 RepID=UPI003CD0AE8C